MCIHFFFIFFLVCKFGCNLLLMCLAFGCISFDEFVCMCHMSVTVLPIYIVGMQVWHQLLLTLETSDCKANEFYFCLSSIVLWNLEFSCFATLVKRREIILPIQGIEPLTIRISVWCSTDCANSFLIMVYRYYWKAHRRIYRVRYVCRFDNIRVVTIR